MHNFDYNLNQVNLDNFDDFIAKVYRQKDKKFSYEQIVDHFCEISSHYKDFGSKGSDSAKVEQMKLLILSIRELKKEYYTSPTSTTAQSQKSWFRKTPEEKLRNVENRILSAIKDGPLRETKGEPDEEAEPNKPKNQKMHEPEKSGDGDISVLIPDIFKIITSKLEPDELALAALTGIEVDKSTKDLQTQAELKHKEILVRVISIIEDTSTKPVVQTKMKAIREEYLTKPASKTSAEEFYKELSRFRNAIVDCLVAAYTDDRNPETAVDNAELQHIRQKLDEFSEKYKIFNDLIQLVKLKILLKFIPNFTYTHVCADKLIPVLNEMSPEAINSERENLKALIEIPFGKILEVISTFVPKLFEIGQHKYIDENIMPNLIKRLHIPNGFKTWCNELVEFYIKESKGDITKVEILIKSLVNRTKIYKNQHSIVIPIILELYTTMIVTLTDMGKLDQAKQTLDALKSFISNIKPKDKLVKEIVTSIEPALLISHLAVGEVQEAEKLWSPFVAMSIFGDIIDFNALTKLQKKQIDRKIDIIKLTLFSDLSLNSPIKTDIFINITFYLIHEGKLKEAHDFEQIIDLIVLNNPKDQPNIFYREMKGEFAKAYIRKKDLTRALNYLQNAKLSVNYFTDLINENFRRNEWDTAEWLIQNALKTPLSNIDKINLLCLPIKHFTLNQQPEIAFQYYIQADKIAELIPITEREAKEKIKSSLIESVLPLWSYFIFKESKTPNEVAMQSEIGKKIPEKEAIEKIEQFIKEKGADVESQLTFLGPTDPSVIKFYFQYHLKLGDLDKARKFRNQLIEIQDQPNEILSDSYLFMIKTYINRAIVMSSDIQKYPSEIDLTMDPAYDLIRALIGNPKIMGDDILYSRVIKKLENFIQALKGSDAQYATVIENLIIPILREVKNFGEREVKRPLS